MSWPRTCSQTIRVNFPQKIFLGSEYTITLPKSGDMITAIRLVLDLPSTNVLAEQIINKAEFLVDDTTIESITGDFLQILNNFTVSIENQKTYQTQLTGPFVTIDLPFSVVKKGFHMVTVPSLRISLASEITQAEIKGYLLVDYSLIEDAPKPTFIQRVNQNQNIRTLFKGATFVKIDTAFVGPIFNLFFSAKVNGVFVDYIQNVRLVANGQERFNLNKQYLKYVEPLKIFESVPTDPILFYTFGLEADTPSGSMNFSRLDTQRFEIDLLQNTDTVQIDIWAQSHNFMYFNSSNVLPVFETRELLLSSAQDKTLTVLQDLPVTVSYRSYKFSVSIFYYIESDVVITPLVESIFPENSNIVYSSGVITINNVVIDMFTYVICSFSAPGYNTVKCAIAVNTPISSYSYSLSTSKGVESFTQVSSLNVKTDQTINLFIDGYQRGAGTSDQFNSTVFINTTIADPSSTYVILSDSYGIKNIITSSVIDYDDSQYIGMMSTRNAYNKDQTVYTSRPLGGCLIKYSPSGTINWLINLPGTNPLLTYLYPDLYSSSQIQQYTSADAVITKVSCNNFMSLALDNKGVIYYGGSNTYGEDGNSGINPAFMGFYVPKSLVGKNLTIVDISCGKNHAVLVDSNGGVWVTGLNSNGQLGLGDTTNRTAYEQVNLGSNRFSNVACGDYHTVLLSKTGKLWTAGLNSNGQLGTGDTTQRNTFQLISGSYTATQISAGKNNSAYISGTIAYLTGDNSNGQLGTGSAGGQVSSFQSCATSISSVVCGTDTTMLVTGGIVLLAGGIGGLTTFTNANTIGFSGSIPVTSISASRGYKTNFIVDNDGYMWVQGTNGDGEAGTGTVPLYNFIKITQGYDPPGSNSTYVLISLPKMTQVSTGLSHSIAIDVNGKIWAAGGNGATQNNVRVADSMGMTPPGGIFKRNNIFQQSMKRSCDISVSIIDKSGGKISNSTVISGAGISNNLTNDANGLLYVNSIRNDSVSYSTLVSVSLSGLVTCVPTVPVKVGDYVSFSCLPSGFIKQGYVVSSGFYLSTSPSGSISVPGSAMSSLPLIVTVGQNVDKGYTYTLDSSLKIMGSSGPFGTKCFSYLDRFDNYYISYIDSTASIVTLKYKSWSVTVSNSPCKNCMIEVDFLENIYFVGDYASNSVITGGGSFSPSWSAYGGTFIMKMNQSGTIKWIIQIQNNSGGTQYSTITKILANKFTGTMYISGYINRNVNQSTINTVSTSVSASTYTINVTSEETGFYSNGIFGFEFIFDPAGNLNPDYTIVPSNDFFQVPYENLIGLHPVSTLPIADFYPPKYKTWPPFNLVNSTLITSVDDLTSTATLSNSPWGNGQYIVNSSSVYDPYYLHQPAVLCFDYKNFTQWLSFGYEYDNITGYYYGPKQLAGVYGEYVWIRFPTTVKAKYLYILQDSDQYYALNYTVLGSNDGSTWTSIYSVSGDVTVTIIQSLGQNVYKVSDATKLYKGMSVNGANKNITNIDYDYNNITLSSSVSGSSITFNQMFSKIIYLNSPAYYQYYAFSQQRVKYPASNPSYNTGTRIYSLVYYEEQS
jgi:alpha-tubulin suppressor-like RCC1 family protein